MLWIYFRGGKVDRLEVGDYTRGGRGRNWERSRAGGRRRATEGGRATHRREHTLRNPACGVACTTVARWSSIPGIPAALSGICRGIWREICARQVSVDAFVGV